MDKISKYNVVHHFQKRSLLIAINGLAGLSIFFFGYDQGMMAGVSIISASIRPKSCLLVAFC
jgi:hypothetical protein